MKTIITIFILSISSSYASDINKKIIGEWAVAISGGPTIAIFLFDDDGKVFNPVTETHGVYRVINDTRLLIEFSDQIILADYIITGENILLSGVIAIKLSPLYEIDLTLTLSTVEKRKVAKENHLRLYATVVGKPITNNLRKYASAAQQYMLDEGKRKAGYHDIVGQGKHIRSISPVNGENYKDIIVKTNTTRLSVTTKDGYDIDYDF